MLRVITCGLLACLGGLTVTAASARSECPPRAPASTSVICSDTGSAQLDRQIAAAFEAARKRLGEAARGHLLKDQDAFRQVRAHGSNSRDFDLEVNMAMRRDFLNAVQPASGAAWRPHWGNHHGTITVNQQMPGRIVVRVSAMEPTVGAWTCEFDEQAEAVNGQLIVGQASARLELGGPNEGWTLALKRTGDVLIVEEIAPAGASRRPFCTGPGSLAGVYFALQEPEVAKKEAMATGGKAQ
ncbi:MAG TPA: hypothetical protein PLQ11_10625 [Beijerinckiaceae bacterium]|nr:hypothetical protein [Beijerinckiaceae bacterium]